MSLKKLGGNTFNTIRNWLFERDKTITPNPLKPAKKKIVTEKEIDVNKLQSILIETHDPGSGLINQIVNEVNDLIKRVIKLEDRMSVAEKDISNNDNDIKRLQDYDRDFGSKYDRNKQSHDQAQKAFDVKYKKDKASARIERSSKSTIGHTHTTTSGTAFPSISKKGGKLQKGGSIKTQPVPTAHKEYKKQLIKEIMDLQKEQ